MTNAFDIHRFPAPTRDGPLPTPDAIGAKAHNLMRMAGRGLPVPPGFVLGTSLCRDYLHAGAVALKGLDRALSEEMDHLGSLGKHRFGDTRWPLLVSVRSGAAISMPGMMDTVLNIGLTDGTVEGLIRSSGNPRLAWDSYRRLVAQYAVVVKALPSRVFETAVSARLAAEGLASPSELDTATLIDLTQVFKEAYRNMTGEAFPQTPEAQLREAIEAVLRSWSSDRAKSYRRLHDLPDSAGTATTVQQMVFGNAGGASGAGVGFSRDPASGANAVYLDFLPNAQGEDVVAGTHNAFGDAALKDLAPEAHGDLLDAIHVLEDEFGDMQDFEFTVERGRLFLLQARSGKRTALAALNIAIDLVDDGLIEPARALELLADMKVDDIEILSLEAGEDAELLAQAVPASIAVAVGAAVCDPSRVAEFRARNEPVILIREQASTDDVAAIAGAAGLITAAGARTSHAAVVTRQLGKVCLVGCESLSVAPDGRSCRFGEACVEEGEILSVDGNTGRIYRGALTVRRERPDAQLARIAEWRKTPAAKKRSGAAH